MLVLALAVAVALLLPLLTGGSYTRLVMTHWRWGPALFVGLGLQIVLELVKLPVARRDDLGFGLLLVSYGLIIAFCARNLLLRGMAIVLIGVCCNAFVIALNTGMPVDVPPDYARENLLETTVKHHPQDSDDRLTFLGDIIILRSPFDTAISFGDLIIAVGLCDVTFHASRKRRSRRSSRDLDVDTPKDDATWQVGPTIDLTEPDEPVVRAAAGPVQSVERALAPTARSSALSTRSS
jgi:hypothetical protein